MPTVRTKAGMGTTRCYSVISRVCLLNDFNILTKLEMAVAFAFYSYWNIIIQRTDFQATNKENNKEIAAATRSGKMF